MVDEGVGELGGIFDGLTGALERVWLASWWWWWSFQKGKAYLAEEGGH